MAFAENMYSIEILPSTEEEVIDRLVSDLPDLIDGLGVMDLERSPDIRSQDRPDLVAHVGVGGISRGEG